MASTDYKQRMKCQRPSGKLQGHMFVSVATYMHVAVATGLVHA